MCIKSRLELAFGATNTPACCGEFELLEAQLNGPQLG